MTLIEAASRYREAVIHKRETAGTAPAGPPFTKADADDAAIRDAQAALLDAALKHPSRQAPREGPTREEAFRAAFIAFDDRDQPVNRDGAFAAGFAAAWPPEPRPTPEPAGG